MTALVNQSGMCLAEGSSPKCMTRMLSECRCSGVERSPFPVDFSIGSKIEKKTIHKKKNPQVSR